jgi:type I restriction enzyme, S subunit
MSADRLLRHFGRVADALDGVARLRLFILDLAVRGKLVPQDATEEPASQLLGRIVAEKARMVSAREIRQSKTEKAVDANVLAFDIKPGWHAATIKQLLLELQTGPFGSSLHQSDYQIGGVPVVNPASIQNERIIPIAKMAVGPATLDRLSTFKLRVGDIVMGRRGEMGRCAVVTDREAGWLCGTGSLILRLPSLLFARFLVLVIGSPYVRAYLGGSAVGATMQNLNQSILLNLVIGLPPLAEQHRIVAKVDELMVLCDRLEAARVEREAMRDRLSAASLARLKAPDPDTFEDDARFALDALPTLTTRPDQIKRFRQTIFNLAVRGKLARQDTNDESALELLKRITVESTAKKAFEREGESLPFDVSKGWVWTRLGRLVAHSDAGWSPKTEDHPRRGDEWGVLKVSAVSWDLFQASANKQVLPGTEPRLQAQVKRGDFLISRANTAELIARAVIVDEDPIKLMMSDKIVRLTLSAYCDHRYILIVNNYADFSRDHYIRHASGVSPSMKNISRNVIMNLPIPLPPLAEQHRIIAKIDALMALCDRLEASLTTRVDTRDRLLDALLYEALSSNDQLAAGQPEKVAAHG